MRPVKLMIRRSLVSAVCYIIMTSTILVLTIPAYSQPSTALSSSLPTTLLSPDSNTPEGIASCELCRKLEGRPGSDLKLHRRPRDKGMHTHKKAKGISKSPKQSLRSQLPHRKLQERDDERDE